MVKRILVIALVMAASVGAEFDQTPLKIVVGGNGYTGTNRYTILWLAQHVDGFIAGSDTLWDSLWAICNDSGKDVWVGPYASSQEVYLAAQNSVGAFCCSTMSYADRMDSLKSNWLYIYAEHYLDSIGKTGDTAVVHIADSEIGITLSGGGHRRVHGGGTYNFNYTFTLSDSVMFIHTETDGTADTVIELNVSVFDTTFAAGEWTDGTTEHLKLLAHYGSPAVWNQRAFEHIIVETSGLQSYNLPSRRFTYQYWNNSASDTFYPMGVVGMANVWSEATRKAIAYAFKRRFIEDSASGVPLGTHSGRFHYNAYYMDNQYWDAPLLSSYYSRLTTTGGPTAGKMDWIEYTNITDNAVQYNYGLMDLDSTIRVMFDSAIAANSWGPTYGFANVQKFNPTYFGYVLNSKGPNAVSIENPIDYTKGSSFWSNWLIMADTANNHMDRQIAWGLAYDLLCSPTPSNWLYDSSRIAYYHFSFYLSVMDTNTWYNPMRFNDTTRWRDVFEINPGTPGPTGTALLIDTFGTGSSTTYLVRRYFLTGLDTMWVFYRTSYSGAGYTTDSELISLGRNLYKIDVNADTSATTYSSVYLKPYQAWIGTSAASGTPLAPAIGLDPNLFLPTATVGGGDPANDSIVVTNTGGGVLSWTATKLNSWLSISPTTGGHNDTIIFSISISGMEAGTYYDTVTVTDAAASNSPQKAPITLTIESAPVGVTGRVLRGKVYLKGKVKI